LAANPNCTVHIFDKDQFDLDEWFPDYPSWKDKVYFHRFLIGRRDNNVSSPPERSLESIMTELGHRHIDVLKMDIEGAEWDILTNTELPSIGQLLVEVHESHSLPSMSDRFDALLRLFTNLEDHGLRLFHKEVNALHDINHCIEYAFIQSQWEPQKKNYSSYVQLPARGGLYRMNSTKAAPQHHGHAHSHSRNASTSPTVHLRGEPKKTKDNSKDTKPATQSQKEKQKKKTSH
jgi:hypothetical protein